MTGLRPGRSAGIAPALRLPPQGNMRALPLQFRGQPRIYRIESVEKRAYVAVGDFPGATAAQLRLTRSDVNDKKLGSERVGGNDAGKLYGLLTPNILCHVALAALLLAS